MQNNCSKEKAEYAGFWVRLSAYLIDMAIICIPLLILRLSVSGVMSVFEGTFLSKGILFQYTLDDIVVYIAQAAYFIACTYLSGMTVGKKLMNLQVVYSEEEQKLKLIDIIYRETIGRFLSNVLYIGYICIGLDKEKRGFHDFLSDTRVVYAKKVKIYQTYHPYAMPPQQMMPSQQMTSPQQEVQSEPPVQQPQEVWHMPQTMQKESVEDEMQVERSWQQFYVEGDEENREEFINENK